MDNKKLPLFVLIILSFLFGGLFFIYLFGYKVINPLNTDWILNSHFDLKMQYIAWEFYRDAPLKFPLGMYNTLSYPEYTSIINNDAIPLFAVFFKFLSPILPNKFQYFGIFSFLAYCLQSVFGMIICYKYTYKSLFGDITAILCGILFTIVPILPYLSFYECCQTSHWLILLSFIPIIYYNELTDRNKILIYLIIAFLSIAINAYFTVICGIIMFCYMLYDFIEKKNIRIFYLPILYILVSIFIWYLLGGFSMNTALTEFDTTVFYIHGFRLNAFINPMDTSSIFKRSPVIGGYMYFGAGIILLLLFAIIGFFKRKEIFTNKKLKIILIIMLLSSFILSLAPIVKYGETTLFEINFPDFYIHFSRYIRVKERFMWITYYMLIWLSTITLIKLYNKKILITLFIIVFSIQLFDMNTFFNFLRNKFNNLSVNNEVLENNLWNKLKENNLKVIYPDFLLTDAAFNHNRDNFNSLLVIGQEAYNNNLYLNNFYFGKTIKNKKEELILQLLNPGDTDLFVFFNYAYPRELIEKSPLNNFYIVDGYLLASLLPLKGFEDVKIPKSELLNNNKN